MDFLDHTALGRQERTRTWAWIWSYPPTPAHSHIKWFSSTALLAKKSTQVDSLGSHWDLTRISLGSGYLRLIKTTLSHVHRGSPAFYLIVNSWLSPFSILTHDLSVTTKPSQGLAESVVPGGVMEIVTQVINGAEWRASLYLVSYLQWPLPVPGNSDKQMAHLLVWCQDKLISWAWLGECWDTGIPKQCGGWKGYVCKPRPKCAFQS